MSFFKRKRARPHQTRCRHFSLSPPSYLSFAKVLSDLSKNIFGFASSCLTDLVSFYKIQRKTPDVYTRVSNFIGWIEETILRNGGMTSCGKNCETVKCENSFADEDDSGVLGNDGYVYFISN